MIGFGIADYLNMYGRRKSFNVLPFFYGLDIYNKLLIF